MKKRRAWKKQFDKFFKKLTEQVLEHYPEEKYYHSSKHITDMLSAAKFISEKIGSEVPELKKIVDCPEFVYSIVCHDVIYKTGANDNEEKSAEFACEFAEEFWQFDKEYVTELILSTKEGAELDTIEKKILHDLDYMRFMNASSCKIALHGLQEEVLRDGFTKMQFFVGSLNFYNDLLKKEKIFVSPLFEVYNDRAKENIKETIKYLYENFS